MKKWLMQRSISLSTSRRLSNFSLLLSFSLVVFPTVSLGFSENFHTQHLFDTYSGEGSGSSRQNSENRFLHLQLTSIDNSISNDLTSTNKLIGDIKTLIEKREFSSARWRLDSLFSLLENLEKRLDNFSEKIRRLRDIVPRLNYLDKLLGYQLKLLEFRGMATKLELKIPDSTL